jgi:hypothetical protein
LLTCPARQRRGPFRLHRFFSSISGTALPGIAGLGASVGLEDNLRIQQVKVGVNNRSLPNFW